MRSSLTAIAALLVGFSASQAYASGGNEYPTYDDGSVDTEYLPPLIQVGPVSNGAVTITQPSGQNVSTSSMYGSATTSTPTHNPPVYTQSSATITAPTVVSSEADNTGGYITYSYDSVPVPSSSDRIYSTNSASTGSTTYRTAPVSSSASVVSTSTLQKSPASVTPATYKPVAPIASSATVTSSPYQIKKPTRQVSAEAYKPQALPPVYRTAQAVPVYAPQAHAVHGYPPVIIRESHYDQPLAAAGECSDDRFYAQGGIGPVLKEFGFKGVSDGQHFEDVNVETGWNTRIAVGYEYHGIPGNRRCSGRIRVGVDGIAAYSQIDEARIGGATVTTSDSIRAYGSFLYAEFEPYVGLGRIRPYAGIGVGIAGLDIGKGNDGFDTDWNLAYKLTAGISVDINEDLEGFGEYHFIGVPDIDLKADTDGASIGEADAEIHSVNMGLRYHF